MERVRVAINGYGIIGKRVADAVMVSPTCNSPESPTWQATGVSRWRLERGRNRRLHAQAPCRRQHRNLPGRSFIVQGGEKHDVTGHSFAAETSFVGDELLCLHGRHQAIVIPESIDAIRALTGLKADAAESMRVTNRVLGIDDAHSRHLNSRKDLIA